jgi:hypothetical protein
VKGASSLIVSGVSRFGVQAGIQAPDPTLTPPRKPGRGLKHYPLSDDTHILPADYALSVTGQVVLAETRRTAEYVLLVMTR